MKSRYLSAIKWLVNLCDARVLRQHTAVPAVAIAVGSGSGASLAALYQPTAPGQSAKCAYAYHLIRASTNVLDAPVLTDCIRQY